MPSRIIIIEVVPDTSHQRYDTVGDWFWDAEGNLRIKVVGADPVDEDSAFLIALHELVEAKLCFNAGVTQGAVDAFDMSQSATDGEPGDSPEAPYRTQHRQAMLLEHLMANFLGLLDYGIVE